MQLLLLIIVILLIAFKYGLRIYNRRVRRDYYHEYLKSDEWQRKRYIVLRRDNYTCVYCGNKATQVHHLKYAKNRIGKEPIEWLVSVCDECHEKRHRRWL